MATASDDHQGGGPPQRLRRRFVVCVDWDETLTSHDTLSLLAPKDAEPAFSHYAKAYWDDLQGFERDWTTKEERSDDDDVRVDGGGPREPSALAVGQGRRGSALLATLLKLRARDAVEWASVERVERDGLFGRSTRSTRSDTTLDDDDVDEALVAAAKDVVFRHGWREVARDWIAQRRRDESLPHTPPRAELEWHVISVNWSARLIRLALRAASQSASTRGTSTADACMAARGEPDTICCNEIDVSSKPPRIVASADAMDNLVQRRRLRRCRLGSGATHGKRVPTGHGDVAGHDRRNGDAVASAAASVPTRRRVGVRTAWHKLQQLDALLEPDHAPHDRGATSEAPRNHSGPSRSTATPPPVVPRPDPPHRPPSPTHLKPLSVYAGDSTTDLACVLRADVALLLGEATSLRAALTDAGIEVQTWVGKDGAAEGRTRRAEKEGHGDEEERFKPHSTAGNERKKPRNEEGQLDEGAPSSGSTTLTAGSPSASSHFAPAELVARVRKRRQARWRAAPPPTTTTATTETAAEPTDDVAQRGRARTSSEDTSDADGVVEPSDDETIEETEDEAGVRRRLRHLVSVDAPDAVAVHVGDWYAATDVLDVLWDAWRRGEV